VNVHEERAWKLLVSLGARETMLAGKHALDLSPIRLTSKNKLCLFVQAVLDVVGRSNANRRHVDRRGCPIYVVTDFYTVGSGDRDRHVPEIQALLEKSRAPATYAQVKRRLLDAIAAATATHGADSQDERWIEAAKSFPEKAEDVPAYRENVLPRLAPETRKPLEEALSWVTESKADE
jgi:hypothetical protein